MALKPEFIGLLRDIRDRIYPQIDTWHEDVEQMKNDVVLVKQDVITREQHVEQMEQDVENIANSVQNITIGSVVTAPPKPDNTLEDANVSYNATQNEFDFIIPAGVKGKKGDKGDQGLIGPRGDKGNKGDKGDPYQIDAEGLFSERVNYDGEAKNFSFLAIDSGKIYWKMSDANADWSGGIDFGANRDALKSIDEEKNILYNSVYGNEKTVKTVNTLNFDGMFHNKSDGTITYDMWQKIGQNIYQKIKVGDFVDGETYTKATKVYINGVLDSSKMETFEAHATNTRYMTVEYQWYEEPTNGDKIRVEMFLYKGDKIKDFRHKIFSESVKKAKENIYKIDASNIFLMPISLTGEKRSIMMSVPIIYDGREFIEVLTKDNTPVTTYRRENVLIIEVTGVGADVEMELDSIYIRGGYYSDIN